MNKWGTGSLMPAGTGQAATTFADNFGQVAANTGLGDVAMQGAMNMVSGPMGNEDQLMKFYHLMAAHPNEVSLFFLHHLNEKNQPVFLAGLAQLITQIIRREIYGFFNSNAFNGDYIVPDAAAELGYSTITDENLDMIIANMVPLQQISQEIQNSDNQALSIVQQAKYQAMNQEQQQQHQQQQQALWMQQQQQQVQQQQMMPPQRPSLFGSLLKIGTVAGAGAFGGAGAQNVATQLLVEQPNQYNQQMYGNQQMIPGQPQPMQQQYQ